MTSGCAGSWRRTGRPAPRPRWRPAGRPWSPSARAGPARCRDCHDGRRQRVHPDLAHRLGRMHGISTQTGFALPVEMGDWHRFTGTSIGSFVGLVPSEDSSGATRSQGSITKTGNNHVRRLLVEAAWHHRNPYRPGVVMRRRWDQAPAAARARGDDGNRRLHRRWASLRCPPQEARRRQHRHRPRTRLLVLVAGHHGRLTATP